MSQELHACFTYQSIKQSHASQNRGQRDFCKSIYTESTGEHRCIIPEKIVFIGFGTEANIGNTVKPTHLFPSNLRFFFIAKFWVFQFPHILSILIKIAFDPGLSHCLLLLLILQSE
jgi:hypothetical protein